MEGVTKVNICLFLLISMTSFVHPFQVQEDVIPWTTKFNLWLWGPKATLTIDTSGNATDEDGSPTVIHRLMSLVHESVVTSFVVNVEPLWDETSGFPTLGMDGILVKAEPFDACQKVVRHPDEPTEFENDIDSVLQNTTHPKHQWILIVEEGHCSLATKLQHAEWAGYSAMLILSEDPTQPENMTEASIFNVFPGKIYMVEGINLAQNYVYPEPVVATLKDLRSEQWSVGVYKIVAAVVIIVIILIVIVTIIVLIYKNQKKKREAREAELFREALQRALELMPITIWELNQLTKDEKCHICYGLFYPNDVIRTLPCYHRFHQRCIISRFDNKNTECAVCHYQVLPPGIKYAIKTSESTPLL